jgi:hypothetical protein
MLCNCIATIILFDVPRFSPQEVNHKYVIIVNTLICVVAPHLWIDPRLNISLSNNKNHHGSTVAFVLYEEDGSEPEVYQMLL